MCPSSTQKQKSHKNTFNSGAPYKIQAPLSGQLVLTAHPQYLLETNVDLPVFALIEPLSSYETADHRKRLQSSHEN